jgi:D-lactate dehydrogenase
LLLNFPNALITAHQAFLTREALGEIARVTTASILQLAAGEASPVWLEGTLLA